MRTLGVAVAILGMALLAFIAMDAVQTAISEASGQATARENGREFLRLLFWAMFFGVIALAILASGMRDVVMSRRDRSPAAANRILHLPLGKTVGAAKSTTLMKSAELELIRLVIPAGKEIPPYRAPGEITVQCIEGHVAFEHDGHAVDMQAGDLLHVCPQETHALKGIVDSSVLVTRLRPHPADELPEKFAARCRTSIRRAAWPR